MNTKKISLLILGLFSIFSYAQLTVDAELRPRFEYRHGFKTLIPNDVDAAAFVSQRTRLNTKFVKEKYSFYLSFQDIRTWGDVKQLSENANSLAIHQAWAKINLNDKFAIKFGRQEVIYDDSRIFGNVGWAQQARSHDLAMLKYQKGNSKFDIGIAYNQEKENVVGNSYTLPSYKTFQYLWYHNNFGKVKASFLFLNNGMQNVVKEETNFSQTIGTHLKFPISERLNASSNLYYQMGKDIGDNDLNAYLLNLDLYYKATDKTSFGLGFELQSGTDYNESEENNSFTPFYGTNHKFNGLMDYFYVGNHTNNVGLMDVYGKVSTKLNDKSSLTAVVHNFSAAAELGENVDKALGTEVDLVYKYKINNDISLAAGYSQMFAQDGMEILKGNDDGNTNNWGWLMLTIKPELFSNKTNK